MDKNTLVDLTKTLISFKTITGQKKETVDACNYICNYLKELHIKSHQCGGFPSLAISNVFLNKNVKKFDLILHGHIDVIPAVKENQYIPFVSNGRLYGRGSLDMKGGLACLLYLMKNSKKLTNNSKKLLLLISSDEEIGGTNGTEYLFKKVGYRGNFFITAEGERKYLLKIKQKGVILLKLKVKGKGEHSAYTWNGENAVEKLFKVYQKIKELFPEKIYDKKHWYSTINLGKISGGLATNSIPEYAEAEIDIRFCEPWESPKDILKAIKKTVKEFERIEIEVNYKTPMMNSNPNHLLIRKLNLIAKKELGLRKDIYFNNHGTNDARFATTYDIPAVGFGPVGKNYHADNEWVDIKSLENYYQILKVFLTSSAFQS